MGLSRSTLSSTSCKRLMPTSSLSTLWVEAALSHSVNGYIYNYIYTLSSPEVPLLDSLCTPSSTWRCMASSAPPGPLCPDNMHFCAYYPCYGKLHSGNGEHGFFSTSATLAMASCTPAMVSMASSAPHLPHVCSSASSPARGGVTAVTRC